MPKGLAIPVGVNPSGGARLVEGDDNDVKIIKLALGSDENENAFQQNIGLGKGMVFEISDETLRARVQRRLVEVFRRFEAQKRYILRTSTIKWEENPATGDLTLSFKFVNLESDDEKDFRQAFNRADRSG
jgi:hypothetical protein